MFLNDDELYDFLPITNLFRSFNNNKIISIKMKKIVIVMDFVA